MGLWKSQERIKRTASRFGRLLPCHLHHVRNFPQALVLCLSGHLIQVHWATFPGGCETEIRCAACWTRAGLDTKINEAWTPGSQSWEPKRRREIYKVIVWQGWLKSASGAGHFWGALMLCFRGESMCLTARDHTSWLIPASSIFLSPMSTTTHPNRPLTKCLLVMTTSNTNISSVTAEVWVNNSDGICLWNLTTKYTLFFSMQNLWKTPSHVWNELLCQLETLRISLGLRSGSLTNWCISWLHRPAEGLWSELNWPVSQKTGIKHSRAHEGNVACPGHKAVCLVAEAGVKSRLLDINLGFLSLCALSDCPGPYLKKEKQSWC